MRSRHRCAHRSGPDWQITINIPFLLVLTGTFSRAFPRKEETSRTMRQKHSSKLQTKMEMERSELMVREELCDNLWWINTSTNTNFASMCFILQSLRSWCMSKDLKMTALFLLLFFLAFTRYNQWTLPPPFLSSARMESDQVFSTNHPGAGHQRVTHKEEHTASFFIFWNISLNHTCCMSSRVILRVFWR